MNRTRSWIIFLPASSAGCDLPAMTSWMGCFGSSSRAFKPCGVAQHEGKPLVGGHAPGKADGEDVRVQHGVGPAELGIGGAALLPGGAEPASDVLHELGAQFAAECPDVFVADVVGEVPAAHGFSLGAELVPGQGGDAGVHPRGDVDAVGHRGDGDFRVVESRPERRRTFRGTPRRGAWPRRWHAAPGAGPSLPC